MKVHASAVVHVQALALLEQSQTTVEHLLSILTAASAVVHVQADAL
jgi:hypothetical protein